MIALWISLGVLALLLTALIVLCLWIRGKAFYQNKEQKKGEPRAFFSGDEYAAYHRELIRMVDWLEPIPCEKIYIPSHDGLRLCGRYYHAADNAPIKIVFHGYRSHVLRDCCGAAKMAMHAGYNLLLVCQRAHGDSEGTCITYGIKEKYDCLAWVNYCVSRFGKDCKILLGGVSMGAATVLMASALPLPPNVVGISADCGYTSPQDIIRKVCREDMGIPDRLAYPFIALTARLFCGFSLKDAGAVEAVKKARVPILIMHGEADDFVPYAMCLPIYENIPTPKQLLSVPGAGHGLCYFADPMHYEEVLHRFEENAIQHAEGRKPH